MQVHKGLPRICDVLLALVGLIISIPLLVLAGLAIRLTSKGPILFEQYRVGLNGKLFKLYKFRTMRVGSGLQSPPAMMHVERRRVAFCEKLKVDEARALEWFSKRYGSGWTSTEVERYVDRQDPDWKLVLKQARNY